MFCLNDGKLVIFAAVLVITLSKCFSSKLEILVDLKDKLSYYYINHFWINGLCKLFAVLRQFFVTSYL